jgi:hypothetical protein
MPTRRLSVFFYGLFMDSDALRAKGLDPVNPRRAVVDGFSLRIGQRATLVPDPDGRVYGVLMDLDHAEIDRLYAEASVQIYRPEAVLAELDDGTRSAALCFNLPVAPTADARNEEYATRLREVARRMALPEEYVERI